MVRALYFWICVIFMGLFMIYLGIFLTDFLKGGDGAVLIGILAIWLGVSRFRRLIIQQNKLRKNSKSK
jgi:hypothetical protein